jgi:hypothetical protein
MQQKLRTQNLYKILPKFVLDCLLHSYLHPPSGVDEVSGYLWQLITAICDYGDGLTLCEQHSEGYDCAHCCVTCNMLWRFSLLSDRYICRSLVLKVNSTECVVHELLLVGTHWYIVIHLMQLCFYMSRDNVHDFDFKHGLPYGLQMSATSLFMPEPEDAVPHGDANLALNDFFGRS